MVSKPSKMPTSCSLRSSKESGHKRTHGGSQGTYARQFAFSHIGHAVRLVLYTTMDVGLPARSASRRHNGALIWVSAMSAYLNTKENMIRNYRHTMLLLSTLALGACAMNGGSSDGMSQQKSGSRTQRETGAQMQAPDTSPEARLLGFLNVANKGDLEGGRLAQERGESMAVKTYGRQMEVDHMQMLQESEGTAPRLGLVPAMGPEAQPVIQEHEKTMHKLHAASGKDFDQCICHMRFRCISASCKPSSRWPGKPMILSSLTSWPGRGPSWKRTSRRPSASCPNSSDARTTSRCNVLRGA